MRGPSALAMMFVILLAAMAGCTGSDAPPDGGGNDTEADGANGASSGTGGGADGKGNGTDDSADQNSSAGQNATTNASSTDPTSEGFAAPFDVAATGCRELLVFVSVPLDNARAFVPEGYTILADDTGQATALAGLKECEETSLDGQPIGPSSTSDVGVFIEAPDGGDEFHYYQLWWTTDEPAYASRLFAQGWRAGFTPDDELTDARIEGTAGELSFTVPWTDGGDYGGQAAGLTVPAPGDTPAVGWYEGAAGTLTVRKVLTASTQGGGHGTLTASDGSLMAQLIGGTEAQGPALYSEYVMSGTVGPEA